MKAVELLDKAALTLHEGFLTAGLGNRMAVVVAILVMAGFPDSLGFCFWLGLGLPFWASPTDFGVTSAQFFSIVVVLVLVGLVGLWLNLRKMASRTPVRQWAERKG